MSSNWLLDPIVFSRPHTDLQIFSRHICFKAEKKKKGRGSSSCEKEMLQRHQFWQHQWARLFSRTNAWQCTTQGASSQFLPLAYLERTCSQKEPLQDRLARGQRSQVGSRAPSPFSARWCLPNTGLCLLHRPSLQQANLNSLFYSSVNVMCCLCGSFTVVREKKSYSVISSL